MSVKILVALNEAFQALNTHLEGMPSSVRSERLRALASIGLQIQTGKLQAAISAPDQFFGGSAIGTFFLQFPVVLNEAYPDLYQVLRDTPARLRAERLRSLALLGLHAVAVSPEPAPAQPAQSRSESRPTMGANPKTQAVPEVVLPPPEKVQQETVERKPPPETPEEPASISALADTEHAPRKLKPRVARFALTLGT